MPADPQATGSRPPPSHPFVTADDHTSLLDVVGWFCVVVIALIVLARLGTKWAKSRTVGLDDGAIILSTIFAVTQTATVSIGVANGLGRTVPAASSDQLIAQQKAVYAFTILFILGQFFAKLSIIAFVTIITPDQTHQNVSRGIAALACIWMVISVFGFAFQCNVPHVWDFSHGKCIDRVGFYTFVEIFNVLLDTVLALFPSFIIFRLQLDVKRKAITIGFFMTRLLVVASSIAQLVVIYSRTEDPFLSWTFALLVMIIQTFGIVTACGPYLKPFLDSVNSGMIGNDDIRRRQGGTLNGYYGTKDSDRSKQSKGSSKLGRIFTKGQRSLTDSQQQQEESELDDMRRIASPVPAQSSHEARVSLGNWEELEVGSQSSRSHIIRQTTTYRVSSEATA
ncbi:hypothetical protein K491DRAFT_477010 [Lophiostoma macrostomum CBS 122681]|uniref:Rhodopsin domain-containing protein n=1 Tax=Lophiostoma macrostomum CBS 122681 TaxID=1314788 RepID=A0A6A6TMY8_9PLEO|nr:hypothetical protein K491DRAFT_477010 [Lophiostoma macrostomum CBS 122681]